MPDFTFIKDLFSNSYFRIVALVALTLLAAIILFGMPLSTSAEAVDATDTVDVISSTLPAIHTPEQEKSSRDNEDNSETTPNAEVSENSNEATPDM